MGLFTNLETEFTRLLNKINIYTLMIIVLSILTTLGLINFIVQPSTGFPQNIPFVLFIRTLFFKAFLQILVTVGVTSVLDLFIYYRKYKKWFLPKSAIISGLFIGSILDPTSLIYIPILAGIFAIVSKHLIRYKGRNIFNPSMLAMFLMTQFQYFPFDDLVNIFPTSLAWWSAVSPFGYWISYTIIFALGLLVAIRFKRLDLVLSFLATYFVIYLAYSLLNPAILFTNQTNNLPLYFFSFFMLIEPKTSPTMKNPRIFYGIVAAIVIFSVRFYYPFNIPLGLLIANLLVPVINKITPFVLRLNPLKRTG